jgi:hypothetical protein
LTRITHLQCKAKPWEVPAFQALQSIERMSSPSVLRSSLQDKLPR